VVRSGQDVSGLWVFNRFGSLGCCSEVEHLRTKAVEGVHPSGIGTDGVAVIASLEGAFLQLGTELEGA
jgi:hypothetical protein